MAGAKPHLVLRRIASLLSKVVTPTATSLRPFSSAAVQVDYDSEYYDDDDGDCYQEHYRILTDKCGDAEGRGIRWVFIGSPGVRKHVYASRISRMLDVPYISMGSLVRQELHPRSSLYKQIANAVNEGKLVPEDIIFALLSKRLEEGYLKGETGFILDGIPRSRVQAEILDQISDIDLVVNFKSANCLDKGHCGSDICSYCGKACKLNISGCSSIDPSLVTRMQHSKFKSSEQGTERTYMEKLCNYREQNKLLEDHYRKQRKLLDFQVTGGPIETWRGLLAALHLQQIDAVSSSSGKLTV